MPIKNRTAGQSSSFSRFCSRMPTLGSSIPACSAFAAFIRRCVFSIRASIEHPAVTPICRGKPGPGKQYGFEHAFWPCILVSWQFQDYCLTFSKVLVRFATKLDLLVNVVPEQIAGTGKTRVDRDPSEGDER